MALYTMQSFWIWMSAFNSSFRSLRKITSKQCSGQLVTLAACLANYCRYLEWSWSIEYCKGIHCGFEIWPVCTFPVKHQLLVQLAVY